MHGRARLKTRNAGSDSNQCSSKSLRGMFLSKAVVPIDAR